MVGQRVCMIHGGKSKQALDKAQQMVELAELKLRGLAPRAVAELEALVTGADSEQVRLQAANSLIDRSVEPPNAFRSRRPSRFGARGEPHARVPATPARRS